MSDLAVLFLHRVANLCMAIPNVGLGANLSPWFPGQQRCVESSE
jgi:hypothetical protein